MGGERGAGPAGRVPGPAAADGRACRDPGGTGTGRNAPASGRRGREKGVRGTAGGFSVPPGRWVRGAPGDSGRCRVRGLSGPARNRTLLHAMSAVRGPQDGGLLRRQPRRAADGRRRSARGAGGRHRPSLRRTGGQAPGPHAGLHCAVAAGVGVHLQRSEVPPLRETETPSPTKSTPAHPSSSARSSWWTPKSCSRWGPSRPSG